MLHHLLESRAPRQRRRGGTAASVVLHTLLVGAAVAATGRAAVRPRDLPEREIVLYRAPDPAEPVPAPTNGGRRGGQGPAAAAPAPPLPRLPIVDAPAVPVDAASPGRTADVAGEFVAHGFFGASGARPAPGAGGDALAEGVVDEPVVPDPANPLPRYPDALRAAGVGGRVTARFVVDTLGRVEPGSVVFVASGDPGSGDPRFEAAARGALARARFRPARAGGGGCGSWPSGRSYSRRRRNRPAGGPRRPPRPGPGLTSGAQRTPLPVPLRVPNGAAQRRPPNVGHADVRRGGCAGAGRAAALGGRGGRAAPEPTPPMPTADRYAKYRADQTTIWVSKNAAGLLNRERDGGESASAVLDRMIAELRRRRRAAGEPEGGAPRAKTAAKSAAKSAAKGVKRAAKGAAKRAAKVAKVARAAAKGGAKAASRAAKAPAKAAKRGRRG